MSEASVFDEQKQWWSTVFAVSAMVMSPAGNTMPGTGGNISVYYMIHKNEWVYDKTIEYKRQEATPSPKVAEVVDPPQIIEKAKKVLGLSVTDLAGIVGVRRPTIYSWMKGQSDPQSKDYWEALRRITEVSSQVEKSPLSRPTRLVRRPLSTGVSLLELLRNNEEVKEEYLTELSELDALEQERRGRKKGGEARPVGEVVSEYGRPTG